MVGNNFFFINFFFCVFQNKKSYIGIMYQRMMKVAKQTGDVDWALQLQATSLKNSTKTQKWYSSIPLMLLAKAGRLEEVGSLLKVSACLIGCC